jgi:molybdate/tungstate transport system substrate-binding protein
MSKITLKCLIFCLLALPLVASTAESQCVSPTGAQIIVWHAGSLSNAFTPLETAFTCQTGIAVVDKSAGSLDIVRQVTAGAQPADVVAPADYLDIDLFLKAGGYVDYDIRFAAGKMVLAYCLAASTGKGTVCGGPSQLSGTIAGSGTWGPPASPTDENIQSAAGNWYQQLNTTGVLIGGSHLYLDPSGYRAPMIFRLAQSFYQVPNLYDSLLEHYLATPATTSSESSESFKLGLNYDYQLTYQNNAYITSTKDSNYRYLSLPDNVNLGNSDMNDYYSRAVIVAPDLFGTGLTPVPASRVEWGVTVMKNAPNPTGAVAFVLFLLQSDAASGTQNFLQTYGPAPTVPAEVSFEDYRKLPAALKPYVAEVFGWPIF